jgi:hypothetical protein
MPSIDLNKQVEVEEAFDNKVETKIIIENVKTVDETDTDTDLTVAFTKEPDRETIEVPTSDTPFRTANNSSNMTKQPPIRTDNKKKSNQFTSQQMDKQHHASPPGYRY